MNDRTDLQDSGAQGSQITATGGRSLPFSRRMREAAREAVRIFRSGGMDKWEDTRREGKGKHEAGEGREGRLWRPRRANGYGNGALYGDATLATRVDGHLSKNDLASGRPWGRVPM